MQVTPKQIGQAKAFPISYYLESKGISIAKAYGNSLYYFSPITFETGSPSFEVNPKRNLWKCFSSDRGGSIIDLVAALEKLDPRANFAKIVSMLCNESLTETYTEYVALKNENFVGTTYIKHVGVLSKPALISYAHKRGISLAVLRKFCKEIYYTNTKGTFYGIGFQNDLNGFEIRNGCGLKGFKGCLGNKAVTSFLNGHYRTVTLFEGFFDFLSFCQIYSAPPNCIVLNSVSMLKNVNEGLSRFGKINLFFDNDEAGERATRQVIDVHGNDKVNDLSKSLYPKVHDLNDYLLGCEHDTQTFKKLAL